MRRVFLTVGPMGSGKTSFCKKIVSANPDIVLVERDAIAVRRFGIEYLRALNAGSQSRVRWGELYELMYQEVDEYLSSTDNIDLILDCYTDDDAMRKDMQSTLEWMGADRVESLIFTPPLDKSVQWLVERIKTPEFAFTGYAQLPEDFLEYKVSVLQSEYYSRISPVIDWCDGKHFIDPSVTTAVEFLHSIDLLPKTKKDR